GRHRCRGSLRPRQIAEVVSKPLDWGGSHSGGLGHINDSTYNAEGYPASQFRVDVDASSLGHWFFHSRESCSGSGANVGWEGESGRCVCAVESAVGGGGCLRRSVLVFTLPDARIGHHAILVVRDS